MICINDTDYYRDAVIDDKLIAVKCSVIGLYSDYSGAGATLFYPGQDSKYYLRKAWVKTGQVSLTALTDTLEQWAIKYKVNILQTNPTKTLNNYLLKRGSEKVCGKWGEYSDDYKYTACLREPLSVVTEPDEGYQVINSLLAEDRLICSPTCVDLLETHLTNYVHGEVDHLIYSLFHGIAYYEQESQMVEGEVQTISFDVKY